MLAAAQAHLCKEGSHSADARHTACGEQHNHPPAVAGASGVPCFQAHIVIHHRQGSDMHSKVGGSSGHAGAASAPHQGMSEALGRWLAAQEPVMPTVVAAAPSCRARYGQNCDAWHSQCSSTSTAKQQQRARGGRGSHA